MSEFSFIIQFSSSSSSSFGFAFTASQTSVVSAAFSLCSVFPLNVNVMYVFGGAIAASHVTLIRFIRTSLLHQDSLPERYSLCSGHQRIQLLLKIKYRKVCLKYPNV